MIYSSCCYTVHADLPGMFLAVPLDMDKEVPHQQKLTQWNPPLLTNTKMVDITTMKEGMANSPEPLGW